MGDQPLHRFPKRLAAEQIARVCHEANRAYCSSIGDDSQRPWYEAPDWQRASAIEGVKAVIDGRVSEPRHSHAGWMAAKLADGWTYGEVKDEQAKTHPGIVAYEQLPEDQRYKDVLFLGVVRALTTTPP